MQVSSGMGLLSMDMASWLYFFGPSLQQQCSLLYIVSQDVRQTAVDFPVLVGAVPAL